jgi:ABC-type Fe3+/spermidine/putrescine transport system ATPase subunit
VGVMTRTAAPATRAGAPDEHIALRLDGVSKRFGGTEAVRDVHLDVDAGTFLTILGPSGSGKTTLLRMIAGFLSVSDGAIWLGGQDVSTVPPGRRGIGMVFQNYALFPHMTVLQNVCYGLTVRGWAKNRRAQRARQVLATVGLEGYDERFPRQLSGGQQQRVALARALAFEPTMLLMDEPLGALDRELRVRMAGELRRLHEELGNTVLYVTHDREEAMTLSDRIAVMRDARLESAGSPQDLYARPDTAFVASFFGGHNLLECELVGDTAVRCLGQVLEVARSPRLAPGEAALLAVPGDGIDLVEPGTGGVPALVHSAVYMGSQIQVNVDVDGVRLRVDMPGGRSLPPPVGSRVGVTLHAGSAMAVPGDAAAAKAAQQEDAW